MPEALEREDVQGLVVRGYGRLPFARYVVGEIVDGAAARSWLGSLAGEVAHGGEQDADAAVQVAFTAAGLRALGLPAEWLAGFSEQFLEGMLTAHRRRVLGDREDNAPEHWDWGGPQSAPIHVLLLVYAAGETTLAALLRRHEERLRAGGIRLLRAMETAPLDEREHFGFRDGISQPRLAGIGTASAADTVKTGEIVLGYRNAYRRFTPRPRVPATADPSGVLAADVERPDLRDLGRNGTYLVFRQLEQDVEAFWRYSADRARRADGTVDEAARARFEAKVVGRWHSGAPLALAPDADRPELGTANDFGYHHADAHGLRCPLGAHVRRANPRDSLDPAPGTRRSIAVNNRHRLLRRGRKYGPPASRDIDPGTPAAQAWSDESRGLHFICLVANIARQFEFLQHTWISNPHFNGLYDEPDPLLAAGSHPFSIPAEPVRERYAALPQFVSGRGGAYFFLPGIRALRFLATLPR